MRILVTGASGFVGRAVLQRLARQQDLTAVAGSRQVGQNALVGHDAVICPDLGPDADWSAALDGIDAIIHCAGRAHRSGDTQEALSRANVQGTVRLAEQAIARGVRRLVFVSSIGVNGNATNGRPFTANDAAAPLSPYGISKHQAELALWQLAERSDLSLTVIRPPLVYGRGAPGNMARLVGLVSRGIPLPFGSVRNARSLVSVHNLADLLVASLIHEAAHGQTFLAGDGQDVSTPEFIRNIARSLSKPALLLPIPPGLPEGMLKLAGHHGMAQQLFGSLQVDSTKAMQMLEWTPPESPETAQWA